MTRCIRRTLCNEVCQGFETGRWFSPGTPVSSTNKTDRQDITKMCKTTEVPEKQPLDLSDGRGRGGITYRSYICIAYVYINDIRVTIKHM
jgi:hypothetical protein